METSCKVVGVFRYLRECIAMSRDRRVAAVFLLLTVSAAGAVSAASPKFRPAPGVPPVIGRYVVTLDASVAEQLARVSAESLAHAYGGQLEPYSDSDVRQFAIAMLPSRARTLSADPRVREVVEIAQSDPTATAAPPSPGVIANAGVSTARHLVPGALDSSSSGNYVYDGAGNITAIGSDTFFYDVEGRLTQATVQGSQQSYTFDAFGNRTGATRSTGAVGCVGGCEATVTVDHQTNHIAEQTYDDAGNVKTGFGAAYKYDGTGMVTEAAVGSDVRDFVYTADDERLAVRRGTSWTWTVRDQGNKVLREFTSLETSASPLTLTTHTWSKDYVWRDGLLLASVFPTSPGSASTMTYHYHLDHLGTPRFVTDGSHVKVAEHVYYPFGAEMNIAPHEGAVELMKFTGHERDIVAADNASVDYMHARLYNGNLGRFLSVDPELSLQKVVHEPQMWNRYAYVTNNPLRYMDPNGQNRWDVANGYFNSLLSDFGLTVRVEQNNADYKIGQRGGDQAGVAAGFVVATASGTGGVITSPTGVGAIAGGVGVVYGLAAMTNAGIHVAQDSSPRGGGGEQLKTIVEESSAAKKADGLTGKMKQGYEQIKDLLASGQPGKNQHALTGDLKGWYAD
jgi:RHS repeat-associated protein